MRSRSMLRGLFLGVCVSSAALAAACGEEDLEPARVPRDGGGGGDATTGPGADATTGADGSVIPGTDGGGTDATNPPPPPPPPPPVDAGPDARNVWAFEEICVGGCGLGACPALDGGVVARSCTTPFARCALAGDDDAGSLDRAYRCIPGRRGVWTVDELCGALSGVDCATLDAGACPAPDAGDGGSLGVNCAPGQARCVDIAAQTLYACTAEGRRWMLEGYCGDDAGPACVGAACPAPDGGGVVASSCSGVNPLTRCNAAGRQYVCASR